MGGQRNSSVGVDVVNAMRVAVVALFFAVSACSHHGRRNEAPEPVERTTVRVQNQSFTNMDIYVLSGGQRIRLGTVTGSSTSTFTIPKYVVNGLTQLRFLADPIGGSHAPVSQEITVSPGDQVTLMIPPQ